MEVMVDAHTWWKVDGQSHGRETVVSLAEHAGTQGVYWVEEPVTSDEYEGYAELSEYAPLAGGRAN